MGLAIETGAAPAAPAGTAATAGAGGGTPAASPVPAAHGSKTKAELKEQALAEPGVQALLEVLHAEIRDVEEM